MKRGLHPDEWDALPLRDTDAVAWWQFVEATKYKPLTPEKAAQLPVKGGVRGRAVREQEEMRRLLYPPDED